MESKGVNRKIRRLDQFLVAAGILKRRSQAQKLFQGGEIQGEDGKRLKAALSPREGLVFTVRRGVWAVRYRIRSVSPPEVEVLGKYRGEAPLRRKLDELFESLDRPFPGCPESKQF